VCRSVMNWLSAKPRSEADIKLKVRSLSEGVTGAHNMHERASSGHIGPNAKTFYRWTFAGHP
jgi:hypothetical protein